jgi:hypothetical protein
MILGVVGNGKDKFTPAGEATARKYIVALLTDKRIESNLAEEPFVVRSGHSRMSGIDIWTEETARWMGVVLDIKAPEVEQWPDSVILTGRELQVTKTLKGYKSRNLDIAESDELEIIVADSYPPNFPEKEKILKDGKMYCYHCNAYDHVKSGACWTGLQAQKMGRKVAWILVHNDGSGASRIR